MANYEEEKQKLENELLQVQVQKAKLEAENLQKSPWQDRLSQFNETIKVIGAIILGIGGAVAGGQGFLYGLTKSDDEKAAVTANEDANTSAIKYKQELDLVSQKFKAQTASMKELQGQFDAVSIELENIRKSVEKLPAGEGKSDLQAELAVLDSSVGHARIDLYSSNKAAQQGFSQLSVGSSDSDPSDPTSSDSGSTGSSDSGTTGLGTTGSGAGSGVGSTGSSSGGGAITKSSSELIKEIFSVNSAVRIPAYSEFLSQYGGSFDALKELVTYAEKNPGNVNGVYNTLVFLANARYSDMQQVDYKIINNYVDSIKPAGKKTEQRIQDVHKRIAKVSRVPLHAKPLNINEIVTGSSYMIVPPASGFINAPLHERKPGLYLSPIIGELKPFEEFIVVGKWKTPIQGYNWLEVEHQVNGNVQTGWLPWGLRETPIVKVN